MGEGVVATTLTWTAMDRHRHLTWTTIPTVPTMITTPNIKSILKKLFNMASEWEEELLEATVQSLPVVVVVVV